MGKEYGGMWGIHIHEEEVRRLVVVVGTTRSNILPTWGEQAHNIFLVTFVLAPWRRLKTYVKQFQTNIDKKLRYKAAGGKQERAGISKQAEQQGSAVVSHVSTGNILKFHWH